MRIYFYPECNFNINKASVYDCGSLAEWFDSQHKNPDDYEIVGRDGEYHDSDYDGEVCAVYPKIMGGKKKGKNILTAVVGLALVLATGGTTAALFANYGGLNMAHALGAGLLLSGGGALLMGKMKMPSMDIGSESDTKQSYQWNVGNLSTSRGVKGVTFGTNVIPEGELLAYRTYGTSTLEKLTRSETYYVNETYNTGRTVYNRKTRKYEPVYGTRRVKKTKTVADSYVVDDESSYLEMLIGAGEGELDSITDIRVNDIPLSDLNLVENTDYAIRLGSNTQTALKQTNLDSQAGYSAIGQTVPVKLNDSVIPLLITTPSACDSCCIAFQTPNWYLYDTSSGAKNKAYIKLKIGYRVSGSSGEYTYLTKTGVNEIDSGLPIKAESAFYFQIVIKFPSNGTYQISIENDSAELNKNKGLLSNSEYSRSSLPDRAVINTSVDNIACYNNKELTYPNTALIWLRLPASQTLNGSMPKVTWKQTRANIYVYNGSSYVTKPADNLAWAIYDIIAQVRKDGNTYHNEGEDVNNIDYDKFVDFASFCDSIGAKGNWFLNKLDTSWSNAMSVATSCRAFIGLRSGKVCPYWDAPTEMTQIFTVGNYENMSGVVTAKKDRAKAIEATFNNEEEDFKSRTVRVEIDNDHSAEAVSMTFVGLSTPESVSKASHYLLRRNKYLVQSIKFTANIDSLVCELNDVIGIQCDITEYGVGGRIFKVEGNKISLDAPVTLTAGNTYALLVRHSDGTLERNTPDETNGTYTQLTFTNAWSKAVAKGDIYSFGITGNEVRKYRVTGIARTSDLKATIEAIEYNENVYDELAVEPYTYSNPNAGINSITTTYNPESVDIAWDANNNTAYVDVYVDGQYLGRYERGTTIPNVNSTQELELVPVNEYGESSASIVRTISNALPTPSTPPVPIVHSTTTGCVAEFDGIPKNENIVWLVIKEGDTELGRTPIMGEYITVSIQLTSGSHTLTAYFLNQYNKTSQGRTFTGVPLGDIEANNISASALKLPTGSILRLSAKNCTTASIAEANGVKDVSGRGNHGQAKNGVAVVQDAEMGDCFSFDGTNDYLLIDRNMTIGNQITLIARVFLSENNDDIEFLIDARITGYRNGAGVYLDANRNIVACGNYQTEVKSGEYAVPLNKWTEIAVVFDSASETSKTVIYLNAEKIVDSNVQANGEPTNEAKPVIGARFTVARDYFKGLITNVRIYPRALSASEIKTIYMFPDDVTFGQLTADLIGVNIVKAQNLIQSEAVITQTAQIAQAVVNNLNVTGNATFQAGLNGIQVGGRNLIKNTSTEKTFSTSSTVNHDYVVTSYAASNVKATDDLTISFEAKASEARWLDFYWNDGTSSYTTGFHANSQLSTSYQKFSYTLKSNRNLDSNYVLRFRQKASESGSAAGGPTIYIKNLIVEMGTRATSWTPAPEDTDASIAASEASAKSYADTGLAAKMSIADYCASNDTTKIDGGTIYTGSILAGSIAANAVNVEKVTVAALSIPVDPNTILKAEYNMFSSGTLVPNRGVASQAQYKLTGAFSSYENTMLGLGYMWRRASKAASSIAFDAAKSGVSSRTIGTSYTLSMIVNISDYSSQPVLMDAMESASSNNNRITIYLNTSRQIKVDVYNASGTKTTITLGTLASSGWQRVTVVLDDGVWRSMVSAYNASGFSNVTVSSDVTAAHSSLTATLHSFGNLATGATADRGFIGHIGHIYCYGRALIIDHHIMLCKNGGKNEIGTITTQMLAADAIKGRTASGGGDGSYTTSGLIMNLSGAGWMSAKNFYISSSGNASFKGAVEATSGSIGDFAIGTNTLNCDYTNGGVTQGIHLQIDEIGVFLNSSTDYIYSIMTRAGLYCYNSNGNEFTVSTILDGSAYNKSTVKITPSSTSKYGLYVAGKARINSTDYGSDEKTKKDFQAVDVLDKLKSLNVCAWRFDEEKLVEKENAWIDNENIKIEAENKAIDEENKAIEAENELRKNRKDGEEVELLPLKEHKKLREHRIADKTANHPLNIGCMAGEFNKAFGTNDGSEDSLSVTDTIGVCMRAIQELAEISDSQKAEIAELKAEIAELKALLKIQQEEQK